MMPGEIETAIGLLQHVAEPSVLEARRSAAAKAERSSGQSKQPEPDETEPEETENVNGDAPKKLPGDAFLRARLKAKEYAKR